MKFSTKDEWDFIQVASIISIIATVVVPVLFVFFPQLVSTQKENSIQTGLIGCSICFLMVIALEIIKLQRIMNKQDEHHSSIEKVLIPKQFQSFFEKNESIDNEIVKRILPKYIENFSFNNNTLTMQGGMWAIECYNEFWNSLVNRQKEDKTNSINVFAVDFSYARIQKEKEYVAAVSQAIKYQEEFISNNGKITRVFLGANERPDSKLVSLFSEMLTNKNYEAYYLSTNKYDLSDSEDFLIVPGRYSCRWYYTNKAKTPNKVTISSIDDLYLKMRLDEILEFAKGENGINLKSSN